MKTILIAAIAAAFVGCTSSSTLLIHHFIDVDEMAKLFPKMPKRDVKLNLGEPLEMRAGLVLSNGEVYEVWLYTVAEKLQEVQGKKMKLLGNSASATEWGQEKIFALTFKNDQLIKWGYADDDWKDFSKEDGDILMPKSETPAKNEDKGGFSLFPSKDKK
ncbi:MAG: hypothetical protein PHC61_11145 [Chitinivibrionales bacterium]|nr:hypothetical protein [Chitinivibrionales bacterium]